METFGERLAYIRKRHNLYQYEVADKLGIHKVTYANYEQDKRQMDYATLVRFCEIFNVSSDFLLGIIHIPHRIDEYSKEEADFMRRSLDVYREVKRNKY
ncbi:helix-turn-helix domain-containing protein [Shouchella miscanthi]|uniref:helix-turn-helix domain-containing protein n=1 Tax=Shouchella miscanthi TaxID=2598861 RepID=UPI0011A91724